MTSTTTRTKPAWPRAYAGHHAVLARSAPRAGQPLPSSLQEWLAIMLPAPWELEPLTERFEEAAQLIACTTGTCGGESQVHRTADDLDAED